MLNLESEWTKSRREDSQPLMAIESGANEKEAQSLARHATSSITMNVYARVRNERLSHIVEEISTDLLDEEI